MTFIRKNIFFCFVIILSTAGLTSCSNSNSAATTSFSGTVALATGETGTLSVTVGAAVASVSKPRFSIIGTAYAQSGSVSATGECIVPGQSTINLTGTYNTSTGALTIASSDGNFNFSGTVNTTSGSMAGNITNSDGDKTGSFSGLKVTADNAVAIYCGTYTGGDSGSGDDEVGTFNVSIDASDNMSGSAQATSQDSNGVAFFGSVEGTTFTACSNDPNGSVPICGVIEGTTVRGKFQNNDDSVGTFCGSTAICTDGGEPAACAEPTCDFPTCS